MIYMFTYVIKIKILIKCLVIKHLFHFLLYIVFLYRIKIIIKIKIKIDAVVSEYFIIYQVDVFVEIASKDFIEIASKRINLKKKEKRKEQES